MGNSFEGVRIVNAANNAVGGMTPGARNIISGNQNGVSILGGPSAGNVVQGNFIGTDVSGTALLGNSGTGVYIDGSNNSLGGTIAGARNVISGNGSDGIIIAGVFVTGAPVPGGATGNVVQGNFIGTDLVGTAALSNGGNGVFINAASGSTIGGTTAGALNIISANSQNGVYISGGGATGNLVQGNHIGTDVTGTAGVSNDSFGVEISGAKNNMIGGTATGAGNVISGGNLAGVVIQPGSTGNLVQGNFIGTDVTGTLNLGNIDGVVIAGSASDNTIGGTASGAGNTIAFNTVPGVALGPFATTTGNAILSNSMFSNGGLGIDLGQDGVSPNDAGDADTGANNLQNFPVLTSATSGNSTTVEMTLNSTANTVFRVEFFSNSACDPSGNGEGEDFLGVSTDVTTDGGGDASLTIIFLTTVPVGQFITATATDPGNNTSEFSACQSVAAAPTPTPTPIPGVAWWGLVGMAGLMAVLLLWRLRRFPGHRAV